MTPFSDIVPYIYDELEKSELFEDDYLDTELKLFKISRMILVSATVDFASCEKLKDNIEYTEYRPKNIIIDKNKNQIVLDVTNVNELVLNNLIMYINNKEIEDFEFKIKESDTELGVINCYIDYEFKENDEVELIFINEGSFNVDLTVDEKYIIALGATYHYLDQKIKDEQKWVRKLGDKDYSITRGSIDNYRNLNNNIKSNLVIYINKYNERNASVDDFM